MMGPGLGGGFGRYQGYFGLVLDNIIDMNVVLADGSMVTVSESCNSDLYWGMRGAGHNFGIVTSFNYKIYDQPVVTWFVETMIFTSDKLETFFELLNILGANGTQPVELVTYTLFAMSPEVSPTEVNVFFSAWSQRLSRCFPASNSVHHRICRHRIRSRTALRSIHGTGPRRSNQRHSTLHRGRTRRRVGDRRRSLPERPELEVISSGHLGIQYHDQSPDLQSLFEDGQQQS